MPECQYCGEYFTKIRFGHHVRLCTDNPEVFERVRAMLTTDVAGVGVSGEIYQARTVGKRYPGRETLRNRYGCWTAVLAAFGLRAQPKGKVITRPDYVAVAKMQEAELVQVDIDREEAQRALEHERIAVRGIEAIRVRPAPGLTVNGRECVACELR